MAKYIIELERGETAYKTVNSNGKPMIQLLAPTPYTEPDMEKVREAAYMAGLKDGQEVTIESQQNNAFNDGYKKCLKNFEQVRKEAYKNGYDAACKDIDIKSKINAAYRKGLDDAWEAVKKLARMNTDTSESITGQFGLHNIMHNLTAYEAIKKIRQYEQKEKITKGDVVRLKSAPEVEILVTYADEEYVGGMALTEVDDSCKIGDQYTDIRIHKVEKTGRHYEIAEVLAKMKEES